MPSAHLSRSTSAPVADPSPVLALQAAFQATEHSKREKSRFLATVSRDRRQPLQMLSLLNYALRRLVQKIETGKSRTNRSMRAVARLARVLTV
jgi:hypothetical protein